MRTTIQELQIAMSTLYKFVANPQVHSHIEKYFTSTFISRVQDLLLAAKDPDCIPNLDQILIKSFDSIKIAIPFVSLQSHSQLIEIIIKHCGEKAWQNTRDVDIPQLDDSKSSIVEELFIYVCRVLKSHDDSKPLEWQISLDCCTQIMGLLEQYPPLYEALRLKPLVYAYFCGTYANTLVIRAQDAVKGLEMIQEGLQYAGDNIDLQRSFYQMKVILHQNIGQFSQSAIAIQNLEKVIEDQDDLNELKVFQFTQAKGEGKWKNAEAIAIKALEVFSHSQNHPTNTNSNAAWKFLLKDLYLITNKYTQYHAMKKEMLDYAKDIPQQSYCTNLLVYGHNTTYFKNTRRLEEYLHKRKYIEAQNLIDMMKEIAGESPISLLFFEFVLALHLEDQRKATYLVKEIFDKGHARKQGPQYYCYLSQHFFLTQQYDDAEVYAKLHINANESFVRGQKYTSPDYERMLCRMKLKLSLMYYGLGDINYERKQFQTAIDYYEQYLNNHLEPYYWLALIRMIHVNVTLDRPKQAERILKIYLERVPDSITNKNEVRKWFEDICNCRILEKARIGSPKIAPAVEDSASSTPIISIHNLLKELPGYGKSGPWALFEDSPAPSEEAPPPAHPGPEPRVLSYDKIDYYPVLDMGDTYVGIDLTAPDVAKENDKVRLKAEEIIKEGKLARKHQDGIIFMSTPKGTLVKIKFHGAEGKGDIRFLGEIVEREGKEKLFLVRKSGEHIRS